MEVVSFHVNETGFLHNSAFSALGYPGSFIKPSFDLLCNISQETRPISSTTVFPIPHDYKISTWVNIDKLAEIPLGVVGIVFQVHPPAVLVVNGRITPGGFGCIGGASCILDPYCGATWRCPFLPPCRNSQPNLSPDQAGRGGQSATRQDPGPKRQ